jgi:hypothetical protein
MNNLKNDAYTLAYASLGKEVKATDGKGLWRIHHVVRVSNSPLGPFQYISHVLFRRHGDDLTHVIFRKMRYQEVTEAEIQKAIRQAVGFTPSQQVVEAFLTYIRRLIEAWEEEDNYYRSQDKDEATLKLESLIAKALERVSRGEEVPVSRAHSKWGRPAFDLYLTSEEKEIAREAQKVLNGSAHEVPDGVPLRDHLADFKKRLAEVCHDKQLYIKKEALIKRRQRLLELLETDVVLRKLVSLSLIANKDAYDGGLTYALPHRLFGYTHDESAYNQALLKLAEIMGTYGLDMTEVNELVVVGSEYMTSGGMLPVAVPSFSRAEGEFAYGDRIVANGRTEKVAKVGVHYVYGQKGDRWEKTAVKHWAESKKP